MVKFWLLFLQMSFLPHFFTSFFNSNSLYFRCFITVPQDPEDLVFFSNLFSLCSVIEGLPLIVLTDSFLGCSNLLVSLVMNFFRFLIGCSFHSHSLLRFSIFPFTVNAFPCISSSIVRIPVLKSSHS